MTNPSAQKSEVHTSTADAESSPTSSGDRETTHDLGRDGPHESPKMSPEPPSSNTEIIRDDSDAGGPIVILSDDPDLIPPKAPKDPFPTDRKPEIDPPVRE
jgi:hypothetical protein